MQEEEEEDGGGGGGGGGRGGERGGGAEKAKAGIIFIQRQSMSIHQTHSKFIHPSFHPSKHPSNTILSIIYISNHSYSAIYQSMTCLINELFLKKYPSVNFNFRQRTKLCLYLKVVSNHTRGFALTCNVTKICQQKKI